MCGRFAIGIVCNLYLYLKRYFLTFKNLQELPCKFNESVIHGNLYQGDENNDGNNNENDNNENDDNLNNDNETYHYIDGSNRIIEISLENFKQYKPSYNVAPTSSAIIVFMQKPEKEDVKVKYVIESLRFGLVPTWKKPKDKTNTLDYMKEMRADQAKYFNCRKETLSQEQSIWKDNKNRRCVVPIQGYYEWQKSTKEKKPYFVTSNDSPFIYLAGLYSHNSNYPIDDFNDQSKVLSTFTIITGPACSDDVGDLSWLHPRKPLVLEPGSKEWDDWLDPSKEFEDAFFETCLNTKKNNAYSSIRTYRVSKDVGKTSSQGEYLMIEQKEEQKPITLFFSKGVKREIKSDITNNNNKRLKNEQQNTKKDITSFFNIKKEK